MAEAHPLSPRSPRNKAYLGLLTAILLTGCRSAASRERAYMQEGRSYLQEGKPREAAIEFANAVRLVPNDVEAHAALARAYSATGATQLAIYEWGTVLQLKPEELAGRVDLGLLLLKTGQAQPALAQARWVVSKQPENAAAQALLASTAIAVGSRDEAIKAAHAAISLSPQRAEYHTQLARLLMSDPKGRDQALVELKQAIQLNPKGVPARSAMAQLLEAKGDLHGAEEQLRQAINLAPRDVEARSSLAALFLRAGDQQHAEEVLRTATDELSDYPEAAPLLERFYQQAGHTDRARSAYEELARRHPNSLALQVEYLRVLMEGGDFSTAKPRLDALVRDHGSDPDVTLLQGYALLQEGKNEAAADLLKVASQRYPERADVLVALGQAQERRGDLQDALSNLRKAVQADASALPSQQALAEFGYRTGNAAVISEAAEQMVLLHANLADGYLWRGVAELQKRQAQPALADLQEALKRRPNDTFATTQLGLALRLSGANDKARVTLEQVLQTSPDAGATAALSDLLIGGAKAAEAVALVQTQVGRSPRSAQLIQVLAQAQMAAGNPGAALASARKAIELAPGDRSALQVFTEASLNNGQLDDPLQRWQQWIADHPSDPHGPAALGALYESAGDFKSAMDNYRRSLSLQGNQPELTAAIAALTAETGGNLDVALSMAQSAYQAAPESAQTADVVGWINYRKGLPASALAPLRTASVNDPSSSTVFYHLGVVEAALGDRVRAKADLQHASALAPETNLAAEINKALSQLDGKGA